MSSPPNKRQRTTRCIYLGPQPKELTENEALKFVVRDFKNLPQKNGQWIEKEFTAFDLSWMMRVFPRGKEREEDYCVFLLSFMDASSTNQVEARLTLQIKSTPLPITHQVTFQSPSDCVQFTNVVAQCLDSEGNFVFDLELQIYVEKKPVWYPKQKLNMENNVISGKRMLESSAEADITFLVGEGKDEVRAHRIILLQRAAGLYEFIKDLPHKSTFEIPSNIDIFTFKILLEHIYTGEIPQDLFPKDGNDEDESPGTDVVVDGAFDTAKNLISAANLYGLTYLKVYIESDITAKLLNYHNAADWLPIADAQVCPLLKEHCMQMFLKDKDKFKASLSGWKQIKESSDLLEELLFYTDGSAEATVLNPSDGDDDNDNDDEYYKKMSVRMIREELDSNDLDLDGTKKILIQRLKDFRQQKLAFAAAAVENEAAD